MDLQELRSRALVVCLLGNLRSIEAVGLKPFIEIVGPVLVQGVGRVHPNGVPGHHVFLRCLGVLGVEGRGDGGVQGASASHPV